MGNVRPELWTEVRAAIAATGALPAPLKAEVDAAFLDAAPGLRLYTRKIARDPVAADDLAQEALATALTILGNFQGSSPLGGWLAGIARNLHIRTVRKLGEALTEDGIVDPVGPEARALAALERREQLELLTAAIAELPEPERRVLELRYVHELSQDAISTMVGEDGRAALVRTRRHLAARLREALAANAHTSSFFNTPDGL